jgi:glycosyltransferase involved in cell wall biosynthesis
VRNADAVFSISRYVTETVVSTGTPRDKVHTVLNCIDPSRWDPDTSRNKVRREFSIPDDCFVLASVSRLFSWKGQRELLRAFAIVKTELKNVRLLIVGPDEHHIEGKSYTDELKTLAVELGVASDVVFTGGRPDIPEIMAACDLFTLPSFEEPFGLVFLEAMVMRRPVVALSNGGTPEVVEHGVTGLLSEPSDVAGLASNIVTLLRDPERRARMGDLGRARVLAHFNPQRMASEAGVAYRALLD